MKYQTECMTLFANNTCNLENNLFVDKIDLCSGPVRTPYFSIDGSSWNTTTSEPIFTNDDIDPNNITEVKCNYINKHKYREPINRCNEYYHEGHTHSYKYVCVKDDGGNKRKIKKKKMET